MHAAFVSQPDSLTKRFIQQLLVEQESSKWYAAEMNNYKILQIELCFFAWYLHTNKNHTNLQNVAKVIPKRVIMQLSTPEKSNRYIFICDSDETNTLCISYLDSHMHSWVSYDLWVAADSVAQRHGSFRKEHANVRCGLCPSVLFSTVW